MMRRRGNIGALLAALGLATVAVVPTAAAQGPLPGSRVWVEGTSTVRDYRCEAPAVSGRIEVAAATLDIARLDGAVRGAEVSVPVAELECGNGTMNSHMRKALLAPDHPTITLRLNGYTATIVSGETRVTMTGTLRIAGQEREMEFVGVATAAPDGGVRVAGSKEFLMSEFGVRPPSLMLGTMKVRDGVTVNFDMVVNP